MKKCKDCFWMRMDIEIEPKAPITKFYGEKVSPCNRFPQNILRHQKEPACGEFKIKTQEHGDTNEPTEKPN